jgi:hypothetical protein
MNTPPRASANNDGIVTPSQGLRYRPNDPSRSMRSSENLISANFFYEKAHFVKVDVAAAVW